MTPTVVQRFRRLLDAGNRGIDFGRPAVRVLLVLLALAAVAVLGTAVWLAVLDTRAEAVAVTDPRLVYVHNIQARIQEATEAALTERPRPDQAGSLVLRIVVNPEGALISTTVAQSSGSHALDELALRIVRESAPFDPFPAAVRKTTRVMEITSAFQFQ